MESPMRFVAILLILDEFLDRMSRKGWHGEYNVLQFGYIRRKEKQYGYRFQENPLI